MPRKEKLKEFIPFSLYELKLAMKHMRNRRCADKEGIILEEIKYGPEELHVEVLLLFNKMIESGTTEGSWRNIMFHMIAKSGDLSLTTNYRPIAILPVLYRIFSRMFYWRLRDKLDMFQADDQAGFRAGIRIEDAICTAESLLSASSEFGLDLWICSLDLKKAFDRIEHFSIFSALCDQAASDPEIALLFDLYRDQTGCVNESRRFDICRGVKQGDALSSLLFNAALESAFKRWKLRIGTSGWKIKANHERLTNTRYADDVLLYAKSLEELSGMLEMLSEEFGKIGLEMHSMKTKILSSSDVPGYDWIDINGMMIQV